MITIFEVFEYYEKKFPNDDLSIDSKIDFFSEEFDPEHRHLIEISPWGSNKLGLDRHPYVVFAADKLLLISYMSGTRSINRPNGLSVKIGIDNHGNKKSTEDIMKDLQKYLRASAFGGAHGYACLKFDHTLSSLYTRAANRRRNQKLQEISHTFYGLVDLVGTHPLVVDHFGKPVSSEDLLESKVIIAKEPVRSYFSVY